ncbi:AAA family ATPase [Bradyrhizobium symbiodeficiens]|uniref:AAA family ATPase n=1 Tax=Bradyrhizobium symbiodeficiens TaxID=1404367 RepID=A0A6G8ZZY0_9BRAD|nr:AAA family ATPase [Bradyrhizobium symbiodeficiens]QIP05777.1 AAA family ATPase [Bradyrhizobium symbiodeficiens]
MRLKGFSVEKLFGLFDHNVPFNLDERVTIIHAPNGFGKTVLLKMIAGMFGGSLNVFRAYEFSSVAFFFEDGSRLEVSQGASQQELPITKGRRESRSYQIDYVSNGERQSWNPDERGSAEVTISPGVFERVVPHVHRLSSRQWQDRARGDIVSYSEIVDRYWDSLPPSARRRGHQPPWLEGIRGSIHCRLIETQRLVAPDRRDTPFAREEEGPIPAVKAYTNELSFSIGKLLAESATLAQTLDQTFPNRLLERMHDPDAPSEESLRTKLADLEKRRSRLAKAGLLNKSDEGAISPTVKLDVNTRKILAEYVHDTSSKLDFYTPMLRKLELFTDILNARYKFKTVRTSRSAGVDIKDHRGQPLTPESLSSGEQHELILIYDLLFKTNTNTLILIDEPEISLHVAWQKRFIPDLQRIIELTEVDAVLATHSAQIIGSYLDLTVQLQGPDGEVLDSQ